MSARGGYLRDVVRLLYPEPCTVTLPGERPAAGGAPLVGEYTAVPDERRARLLAPARPTRVAVGAVRRYAEPQSRAGRWARHAVVAAMRSGASSVLLRDRVRVHAPDGADHINSYLRSELGAEVALSVQIGPARANRKPVLQLLDPAGHTIGYAKLSVNALTGDLVRAESRALAALATRPLTHLAVPTLLHAGRWRDHDVLVCSALPVWRRRAPLAPDRLAAAMGDLARSGGTTRGPAGQSRYWIRLRARLAAVIGHDDGRALAAAARELVARSGGTTLEYGAWHGDWSPWNMASLPDRLLVWDWERFEESAPVGFDAVHHDLQAAVVGGRVEPARAVADCLAAAPSTLDGFGAPAGAARLTALLYLTDLAVRYLADRQAGGRLGVLGSRVLPALLDAVCQGSRTEDGR